MNPHTGADKFKLTDVTHHPEASKSELTDVTRDIKKFKLENRSSPEADELNNIKQELQKVREKVSSEDPDRTLGEWSKLVRDSQLLYDRSSRVTSEGDQMHKETQQMKDLVQRHFFRASENTYKEMYTTKRTAEWDFPDHERDLIEKYMKHIRQDKKSAVEDTYRLETYIDAEHTRNGLDKKVDVNYDNPVDRIHIAYSNSREDEAKNLKPLHEQETEKDIYQRTLPNSELMHHVQQEAIDEYNQEHENRIPLGEKVPDMTFVRHSLSNKEYKALAPQLDLDRTKPTAYHPGDEEFERLMGEVPNFKAVKHFISQHHPHLEVTQITIIPDRTDSAIIETQARE